MRVAHLTAGLVALVVAGVAAQSTTPAVVSKTPAKAVPRTPDNRPDLQGVWDFAQLTPFERPGAAAV